MIPLNLVECKMLEALRLVLAYLTRKNVNKGEYMELMGTVRDAIKTADFKQHGCPQGRHIEDCTCTEEQAGYNKNVLKYFGVRKDA